MNIKFLLLATITYMNMSCTTIKTPVQYTIRQGALSDRDSLMKLYIKVITVSGGLLRSTDEITDEFIDSLFKDIFNKGIIFVAEQNQQLLGAVFKYTPNIKGLSHVLYEGSILVDPDYQGKGIGTSLYSTLLHEVKDHHPEILRVNLKARASNNALQLYERLGFTKEDEFKDLVRNNSSGKLESVVSMVWFNPNFKDIE